MKKVLAIALILLVLLTSCSTMVAIRTTPENAKVKINGEVVGKTPTDQSLSNFDFNDYNLEISKDGYKTLNTSLQKEFKVGPFVLGLLLWWPELLWVYGPKSMYNFELEPVD